MLLVISYLVNDILRAEEQKKMINANDINSSGGGNGNGDGADINPRTTNRMNQNHPDNSSNCDVDVGEEIEGRLD